MQGFLFCHLHRELDFILLCYQSMEAGQRGRRGVIASVRDKVNIVMGGEEDESGHVLHLDP